MSNSVIHPSRGTVRICYAECDARKEVSIFVTLAPDLTEPRNGLDPSGTGSRHKRVKPQNSLSAFTGSDPSRACRGIYRSRYGMPMTEQRGCIVQNAVCYCSQFSTFSPRMRVNSATFAVTSTA
jgi:hypothetical protein